MIVVSSLVTMTLRAWPSRSRVAFSSLRPTSSLMTWPPVRIAMSCELRLAAVAEAGGLDGDRLEDAADLVHDEGRESLAVDVLGDDEQLLAGLDHLVDDRQQVLDVRDLAVDDQDVRVLEDRLLALGVGDEVRRQVALVEAHALGELERRCRRCSTPRR